MLELIVSFNKGGLKESEISGQHTSSYRHDAQLISKLTKYKVKHAVYPLEILFELPPVVKQVLLTAARQKTCSYQYIFGDLLIIRLIELHTYGQVYLYGYW